MIKLTKQSKPTVLIANADAWTNALMSYVKSGKEVPTDIKNRYNNTEIKTALKAETSGKCMYCEGYIGDVSYPHIEHFRPKSVYPNLTFDWENLGLGCQVCNTYKNDVFDENLPYINPYKENPDDYFIFLGTMIMQKPGCSRGENMITQLKLNRVELMEQRKEAINKVGNIVERYVKETNLSVKMMLRKNIEIEIGADKEYSRYVKSAVELLTNERW
jgi:uncharacterized protein (TIGR02646 family)